VYLVLEHRALRNITYMALTGKKEQEAGENYILRTLTVIRLIV
jgi:hypothetical protein